tara:strand:- start:6356 stop:6886 length:531 start_codon:yes stop_codon:yes gene_type:complete
MSDNWNFEIDFSGVSPAGVSVAPTKEGPYKVKIIGTDTRQTASGRNRALFRCSVVGPTAEGSVILEGLNFPEGPDDFVRRYWMAFLMSLGYTEKQLTGKSIKFGKLKEGLIGKTAYAFYTPAVGDAYAKCKWLTEAQYKVMLPEKTADPVVTDDSEPEIGNTASSDDEADVLDFLG